MCDATSGNVTSQTGGLQCSWASGLQGSRAPGLQGSRAPGLHGLAALVGLAAIEEAPAQTQTHPSGSEDAVLMFAAAKKTSSAHVRHSR